MFKMIIKLAWKNAFARLSRTLLVITMIAVSMSMMLSIQGIYDGMTLNMINATLRSDSGELSIYNKKYRLDKQIENDIQNASSIRAELLKNSQVKIISLRYSVEGLSSTARKASFSNIIGIDLDEEEKFGEFSKFLKEGKLSFEKRGALLGSELAKTLKVRIGSKLIFSTQDKNGDINSIALKVRGILQTNNLVIDQRAIYIEREKLYEFLGVDTHAATQIAIRTDDESMIEGVKEMYPHLEVKSFLELNPLLKQMEEMMVIFNSITFAIVMIVVFIGILGVMYVSILDRIREFGIMRSIGMAYTHLRTQILLEAMIVGLIGYSLGALLGFFALLYLQESGLNLSAYAEGMASFGMPTIIYAHQELSYYSNTFYAIILSSILSVLLPLRKIKHLHPIDVIKADT
jgi:ABC-type lipoprotein release transport system permease subunit